jgi:polyadenylation factor subunit 2
MKIRNATQLMTGGWFGFFPYNNLSHHTTNNSSSYTMADRYEARQAAYMQQQRVEQLLQQHRNTVDYFTPLGKYMISKNVYNRRRRRAFPVGSVRPDPSFIVDLPPSLKSSPSIVDMSNKFVHISTNKSRHAIHAVKWTPDARRVVVSSYSGEFTIWNGLTFSFESIMQAHDVPIFSLNYSHNGKWLISGDQAGCIKYWQPNFNNVNILSKAHENAVSELSFSPNDSKFISASDDQFLKIWDFTTAKEECTLKGHHWDVKSCDWHSSLGLVVSGSKDNLVKLWDPRDGTCITTIHDFKHTVSKTAFQKGGNERLLAACSRDHSTRIFDLRMLRAITVLKSESDADLTSLAWHPNHSTMLTVGGYDGSLAHFDITKSADIESVNVKAKKERELEDVEIARRMRQLKSSNSKSSSNPTKENELQQYIFNSMASRSVPIVDKSWHFIQYAHERAIQAIEYHPLGHMLCTASADKSVRFWGRSRPGDDNVFKDQAHLGEEAEVAPPGGLTGANSIAVGVNSRASNEENIQSAPISLPGLSIPGFSE